MKIQIAGVIRESIVDGKGMRYVIFAQGCHHNCKGCHNPETHDPNGGQTTDTAKIIADIKKQHSICGVTFSGGEPFEQAAEFTEIAAACHMMGYDIWCYTGYTYEQLYGNADAMPLLREVDILVDGPFILEQRNVGLLFRGSENQRILEVYQNPRKEINEVKYDVL